MHIFNVKGRIGKKTMLRITLHGLIGMERKGIFKLIHEPGYDAFLFFLKFTLVRMMVNNATLINVPFF